MRNRLIEVKLPWLGAEEVPEIILVRWRVAEGTPVEVDQDLADLTVAGEPLTFPSPLDGKVVQIIAQVGDLLTEGQVLAVIEIR